MTQHAYSSTGLPGYVTTTELAKILNLHPTTLSKWRVARKGPPFMRLGQRILYKLESVEAWLEANEQFPLN